MGTVPVVPSAKPPIGKTMPIVLVLTGAVVLIGASTPTTPSPVATRRKRPKVPCSPARPPLIPSR